ncbi:MAG: hypothetical protein JO011_15970, partial [Ktedonobacteraceae bacterium]|nr:hypothetical protein [Ktedonobacteraceae bacterium]
HPEIEAAPVLLQRILAERRAKWEEKVRTKGKDPQKERYVEPAGPGGKDLYELPGKWCWATVEQVTSYLRNGLSQAPNSSPPGHRILRINAVRPMYVDLNEVRYLPLGEQDIKEYFLEDGDILFTRYNGSSELLGVAGMVRNCSIPTLHPDKLIRVKTFQLGVRPSYFELASNIGASRAHIEARTRTTAGQKGISGSDIKQMPFPLPPLAEQEQIVSEVEQQLSIINKYEAVADELIKRAEWQRQAILQRAFSGQLVKQDPNDEPASVLLERIQEERKRREKRRDVRYVYAREDGERLRVDPNEVVQEELWQSGEKRFVAEG